MLEFVWLNYVRSFLLKFHFQIGKLLVNKVSHMSTVMKIERYFQGLKDYLL